jgi:ATP-dependent helicase HrpA
VKALEKQLDPRRRLMLGNNPDGSLAALLEDCADAAVDVLVSSMWNRADFEAARQRVVGALAPTTADILGRAEKALTALQEVLVALPGTPPPAQAAAVADIRRQLDALVGPGFVAATGAAHLVDLARYLTAISRRLERLSQAPAADGERMARVQAVQQAYDDLVQALSPARGAAEDVRDIARLIQEFRVSLWAQQLGTARPVSEQRIYRAIDAVLER